MDAAQWPSIHGCSQWPRRPLSSQISVSKYDGTPFIGGYHPVPNANDQDLSTLVHRELQKENDA